jgi:hypothetical protein
MIETSNDTQYEVRFWNPDNGGRFANIEIRMQNRRRSAT